MVHNSLISESPTTPAYWRKQTVPRGIRLLASGLTIYLVAIHLWTWHLTIPFVLSGRSDFRQFYAAGAIFNAGQSLQLYDYATQKKFQDSEVSPQATALPFVSPAYHALFFAPFAFLPYQASFIFFLACNLTVLTICYLLLHPWMENLRMVHPLLPLGIFLGFLPVGYALIQGQDSLLLTALLAGGFVLLTRGHGFLAGVLVGLGLFKFSIVLPLALLFLIWCRWNFVFGFLTSTVPLCTISMFLTGIPQTKLYVSSLFAIAGLTRPPTDLSRYPLTLEQMANVHGFVFGVAGTWLPKTWVEVNAILFSSIVLGWTVVKGRSGANSAKQLLLSIPCSVLVSHHTYIHDLSVLLLPIVVLLGFYLPSVTVSNRKEKLIVYMAILMFAAPIAESFYANHFFVLAIFVALFLASTASATFTPLLGATRSKT